MGIALFGGAFTRVCMYAGDEAACSEGRSNQAHEYVFWNCSEMPVVSSTAAAPER